MEPSKGDTTSTEGLDEVSTKLRRIADMARQHPGVGFTSLNHYLDINLLREAHRQTRKDGALGVDGQTAADYAANLEVNLQSLLERAKSGLYRAPAVRRVHIPKGSKGTETRPIGIPTFEDKILQRAVTMVLNPVYEQDFLPCSYGFRPGRSAHDALQALWEYAMRVKGGWIVEVDIQKFFDNLDHAHLRELLRRRVRDGVLLRLIGKWLKAGVLESGRITYPESGSPQGGVISPLLANIYLHHVLDEWFEQEICPGLQGQAYMVRYADDLVMAFEHKVDARKTMELLQARLEEFGLLLHPKKTRLVDFRPPNRGGGTKSGNFEFLGFTHYWGKSRYGRPVVKRKTAPGRFTRALRTISQWCRTHRHWKPREQHKMLVMKIRGHYGYYGITGNAQALGRFLNEVERIWKKWLSRRSQKGYLDWEKFKRILERYPLPTPVVVHSIYRQQRTHVTKSRMS